MFEMRAMKISQELRVERKKISANYEMKDTHFHPYFELYYLYSGSCDTFIQKEIYHIKAGDLVLIPNMEIHKTMRYSEGTNKRIVLNFASNYLDSLRTECGAEETKRLLKLTIVSVPRGQRVYVENLFNQIIYENEQQDDYQKILKRNYVYELLIFMHRISRHRDSHSTLPEGEERFIAATEYICENYAQSLTLEVLAKQFNMSPTYFSKVFKKYTSFGFKEYLLHIRLKEASIRLLESNKSITEIAGECGFEDSNYFSDVFKRKKGITPSQYRKTPMII